MALSNTVGIATAVQQDADVTDAVTVGCPMTQKVLIIEDDEDLQRLMALNARSQGYEVFRALNGNDGISLARRERPQVVLLDLMLPDMSGVDVCRQLRSDESFKQTAIIIVSARTEEIDRVVGFELGADDYVVKPFSVRELMLRIKAVSRRLKAGTAQTLPAQDVILNCGAIRLDPSRHQVWVDDEHVTLTYLEFQLLHVFMERRGRVQSRERLIDDVWGMDVEVTARTVDTHVKRLRDKLGVARDYVETVRGVGYRFREDL